MTKSTIRSVVEGIFVFAIVVLAASRPASTWAQDDLSAPTGSSSEELPPAGQSKDFSGVTKCAACHFPQYKDWKSTPHGNAYNILPKKYRKDAQCLACHTTPAHGQAVVVDAPDTTQLGVSCESCHGPGREHARYALSFVSRDRVFTDEELKVLRSKIQRLALDQCIKCHISKAHKPHPKYDPDPAAGETEGRSDRRRLSSFFDVHGREGSKVPVAAK